MPALSGFATYFAGVTNSLVNGLGVTVLRIPPLVMTLGMTGVIQGALTILTRGVPSGRAAPLLTRRIEPFAPLTTRPTPPDGSNRAIRTRGRTASSTQFAHVARNPDVADPAAGGVPVVMALPRVLRSCGSETDRSSNRPQAHRRGSRDPEWTLIATGRPGAPGHPSTGVRAPSSR